MKKNFRFVLLLLLVSLAQVLFAQNRQQIDQLKAFARLHKQKSEQEKADAIARAKLYGWPIRTEDANGRITELVRLDKGRPVYIATDNAVGASLIHSSDLFTGGSAGLSLSGSGQTLGIWDGGSVYASHQELSGRITQKDVPAGISWHASHVAGTLIASGVDANAKGMSPAANLSAYDWDSDEGEMALEAAAGLKVSQHSYGLITGWASGNWSGNNGWHWWGSANISAVEDFYWGFYSDEAEAWDQIAFNAPDYLIVKSAGNDRGEGPSPGESHYFQNPDNGWNWELSTAVRDKDGGVSGYDCISHAATSKNILTVGAVFANSAMSSFSGWGPTDDGRIKPDIVAKGVSVYSCYTNSPSSYASANGTSMSGPMVSGSVGLLLEHQQNLHPGEVLKASTIKGLILTTATDLGNPGPDYSFGWGLMNTAAAAEIMSENDLSPIHISETSLNNGQPNTIYVKAKGGEPLRVALVWTDVPGTSPAASLDPTTPMLVNDLDVRLTAADGTMSFPYILDPANPASNATTGDNFRDNVEIIHLEAPQANAIYAVSISHKGTLDGGSQDYSLIITGNEDFEYTYLYNASDAASNYSSWTNGSNQGEGLGVWNMISGGNGGSYLGTTGLGNNTFGIYSGNTGSANYFTAQRELDGTIPVGGSFQVDLGYTGVSNGGEIGLNLYSAGNFRLGFKFIGGQSNWQLNDGGSNFSTNIPWSGNTPLQFEFVRGNGNVYTVHITQGSFTYDGVNYTASSGNMAIDRVEFYSTGQGSSENFGFDNLFVTTDINAIPSASNARVRGNVVLASTLELDNLMIEPGNHFTIAAGGKLTVNGSIINQAGSNALELSSNASGTGSLLHFQDNLPITIQRYVSGDAVLTNSKYHTVSIPLSASSNPTAGLFSGAYVYTFDQTTQNYITAGTSTTTPLNNAEGFLIYYPASSHTFQFEGMANNGSFATDVAYPPFGNNFNLVPNPYPSAIDWASSTGWTKTNVASAIYIYNASLSSSGNFVWASYVGGSGTNGGSNEIAAGQAFFVQTTASSPALVMNNGVRLHSAATFLKNGRPNELRMKALCGADPDELILKIDPLSTEGFDTEFDALKLPGSAAAPGVYTQSSDGTNLSINALPYNNQTIFIPVGFEMDQTAEVVFQFEGIDQFADWMTVLFEDLHNGNIINLRDQASYAFNHETGDGPLRFRFWLHGATHLNENSQLNQGFTAWTSDSKLYVQLNKELKGSTLSVFDVSGRLLHFATNPDQLNCIPIQSAPSVLILQLDNGTERFTQKVVQIQ